MIRGMKSSGSLIKIGWSIRIKRCIRTEAHSIILIFVWKEKKNNNEECEQRQKTKDGKLIEGHHLCWWCALMIVSYKMQFAMLKWLAQISKIHWPVDPFKDIEFMLIVFSNFEWCEYSFDEHFLKTSERSNRKTMFNAHFCWRSVEGLCRLPSTKLTVSLFSFQSEWNVFLFSLHSKYLSVSLSRFFS